MNSRLKLILLITFLSLASLSVLFVTPDLRVAAGALPDRLSDDEFWRIVTDFSEDGGYFRSDNFISNETTFQYVIPDLKKRVKPGGVYLGVGPEQNFTYISSIRPQVVFIVDIRRQAMLQHLMYKALFELSENRSEFLSKLFSRPTSPNVSIDASIERIFESANLEAEPELAEQNLEDIFDRLRSHGFLLSEEDWGAIRHVYMAFADAGPEIRYSYPSQYGWRRFPSYADLMLETDQAGLNHGYLATEENFQIVKRLQQDNRVIPIVGDFAGGHALRSIGQYLRNHGATVSAFYTSNVEFYLFQSDDWKKFFNNVAHLPLDAQSTFIRAYFNNYGYRFPARPGRSRSVTLLDSMSGLVDAFDQGGLRTYFDVIDRSR